MRENKHVDVICDDKCMKKLEKLKIKNKILKSSLKDGKKAISKFVDGEKNLNMILSQQKLILDKGGIWYTNKHKDTAYRSYIVRVTNNTCNYYNRID